MCGTHRFWAGPTGTAGGQSSSSCRTSSEAGGPGLGSSLQDLVENNSYILSGPWTPG